MTSRPECPKAQRKPDSPCIFCRDGSYCAHQYYCPTTRRYENTEWRGCRKQLERPADDEGIIFSQPVFLQENDKKTERNGHNNGTSKTKRRNRRKG